MGHTVWYTVTGTGGPITIDTSGSGSDTRRRGVRA